jgi:uncharacterized membrane protein
MMRTPIITILLTAVLALVGCADMSQTERTTLEGAAIGVAGGALIGSFSAAAGKGALIGAGVGAVSGYLYDKHEKSKEEAYDKGYKDAQSK